VDVKNIFSPCHKPTSYLLGDDVGKSIKMLKKHIAYPLILVEEIIFPNNSIMALVHAQHEGLRKATGNISLLLSMLPIQVIF